VIRETVITTVSADGLAHVAPMGATVIDEGYLLQPFRPSQTLDNLIATRCGSINFTDDARIFAGCITQRRRDWPTVPASRVASVRLAECLAHEEFEIVDIADDPVRPRLLARVVHLETHAPFKGMNRAKAAVLEGAILVSRLHMLPAEKIDTEMAYLSIAIEKTAGEEEREAWRWLLEAVETFRARAAS
jgi:hypothetical protein